MRLARLIRTASFQFSALYAAVFGVSVLVLIAIVYWIAATALERQFDLRIEAESTTFGEILRGTDEALFAAIAAERESVGKPRHFRYLIARKDGSRLAGSLTLDPRPPLGWSDREFKLEGSDEAQSYRILTVRLPDSELLLSTGRDTSSIRDAKGAILESAAWALGATLLLGLVGGLFVSSRFLRRIDSMTSAAQAIIDGNLHKRLPVQNTNDDLDTLALTINRMLDRISELMESVRQVSNDIAHDLRTPLSRLRHRLEAALATRSGPRELEETIAKAIEETDHILATFSALLRIAQIEAGTRRAGFADVDLSNVAADVADAFAPSIQDEGRILETRIEPGLFITGDRQLLAQMLANLLENANRHTSPGTRIVVDLTARGAEVILRVADNGPGVPAEAMGRLFGRFYRPEKSRTTPGSGLGLSLVKAIASLHGARIGVSDNRPGLCVEIAFSGRRTDALPLPAADQVRKILATEA